MPPRSGLPSLLLSLVLGLFVHWGCGGGSTPTPPPPPSSPSITQPPVPLTVNLGSSASLTVVATGTAPLSYQWKKEGMDLAGATAATWTLASAKATDAGGYTVTVSNAVGSVSSAGALLSVVVPPSITNQPSPVTVNQGQPANLTVVAAGSAPLSYQWKKNGIAVAGASEATLSVISAQPADGGAYSVDVSNAAGTATSQPAALVVMVPPGITSQPASQSVNEGQPVSFSVVASGSAPFSYQWKKDGRSLVGATASTLSLTSVQASDAGAYAVDVTNAAGSVTSAGATLAVVVAPVITTQPVGFEVIQGQPANLSVVASGTAPLTYQWKKDGTILPGFTASAMSFASAQPSNAGSYAVTVSNSAGQVPSNAAIVVVVVPPGITTQPANQTVNLGQPASFSVVATGTAPLSYQWKKGGIDVAGATASIYSIPAVQAADMASYSVNVTNAAGSLMSASAALVVVVPPTITTQPVGSTVNERQSVSFGVVATGSGPFSYQWRKDGTALNGAAASTFSLSSVLPTDAGSYTVDVSNAAGRASSQSAMLVVNPLAVIKTFKVLPSAIPLGGGGVLQWDVSGATTLSINGGVGSLATQAGSSNVTPSVTTTYTLTAINAAGSNTADAILTVDPTPFKLTSFSASPAQVDFGQSTSIGWSYLGLPLALSLDGTPISGLSAQAAPVRRQSYVLQGSNQGGSDQRALKVAARGIDLVAGNVRGSGSQDGVESEAWFNYPNGVAVAAAGTVYVADTWNHAIRKVDSSGRVTTFAGAAGPGDWKDGLGGAARFQFPSGVALDAAGNVYVADSGNSSIRKISPLGVVTTLAGHGWGWTGADDGPGSQARFSFPSALVVDAAGNVIVADTGNHTIRRVSPEGVVSTLAGSPGVAGSMNGPAATASFNDPRGVTVDADGNVFVADTGNSVLRKITPAGVVSTLAGVVGEYGSTDGPASMARFQSPIGLTIDAMGNLIVSDGGNEILRKITSTGQVSTIAGVPWNHGSVDGPSETAKFHLPTGLAVDLTGNVYVCDSFNHTIRVIKTSGMVSTLAGSPEQQGTTEGTGEQARFANPSGLTVDPAGNIYVADTLNCKVRIITPRGTTSTLAGTGLFGHADGSATEATFIGPTGIARDGVGNVYVSDTGVQTIRKISPTGEVSTFAGSPGITGSADGPGPTAQFNTPFGLAADAIGNVYVADYLNHTIRKITAAGVVTTFAGTPGIPGYQDGVGSAAKFSYPTNVGVDALGNVYVVDSANSLIRKITPAGMVTTLAGSLLVAGTTDGVGSAALFYFPRGLAVTPGGTVFVADTYSQTIRKITSDGIVTTVAGQVNQSAMNFGPLPGLLVDPLWIAVNPDGDLIVVCHNGIVQITAP